MPSGTVRRLTGLPRCWSLAVPEAQAVAVSLGERAAVLMVPPAVARLRIPELAAVKPLAGPAELARQEMVALAASSRAELVPLVSTLVVVVAVAGSAVAVAGPRPAGPPMPDPVAAVPATPAVRG